MAQMSNGYWYLMNEYAIRSVHSTWQLFFLKLHCIWISWRFFLLLSTPFGNNCGNSTEFWTQNNTTNSRKIAAICEKIVNALNFRENNFEKIVRNAGEKNSEFFGKKTHPNVQEENGIMRKLSQFWQRPYANFPNSR